MLASLRSTAPFGFPGSVGAWDLSGAYLGALCLLVLQSLAYRPCAQGSLSNKEVAYVARAECSVVKN